MGAMERLGSYLSRGVYTVAGPFHPFGGAVDVIVVEQPDGSFKSSPWYVRFGKFKGVLERRSAINISVNGVEADFHMHLDHNGEAYFLREVDAVEGESLLYPLFSSDEPNVRSEEYRRLVKSASCNYDAAKSSAIGDHIDVTGGKIVSRSTSRRSQLLRLVFGRRSIKEDDIKVEEGESGVKRFNSLERAEIAAGILEVKWSTNLGSDVVMKEHDAPWFAGGGEATTKIFEGVRVNNEEVRLTDSLRMEDCIISREVVSTPVRKISGGSASGDAIGKSSAEKARAETSVSSSLDKVPEPTSSGDDNSVQSRLEYSYDLIKISRNFDEFAVGDNTGSRHRVESACISDWGPNVHDENTVCDDFQPPGEGLGGSQSSIELISPPSDGSDEEQFRFSDFVIDDPNKTRHVDIRRLEVDNELSLALDKSCHDTKHTDLENSVEESKVVSSPVSIPSNSQTSRDLEGRLAGSLPQYRSPSHKMNSNDHKQLSLSVYSESASTHWPFGTDKSSPGRSEMETTHSLGRSESLDSPNARALQFVLSNPEVELSRCKHLLHEGMGSEAALQAFNSEKLDMDKFASLGPSVVKDDKLVVKINGYYFPWDAAAPVILGMVSFGSSDIFEPKGMIPVDQVGRPSKSDSAKARVPSDGSWGLWPFSMRWSSSRKTLQQISSDTQSYDSESNDNSTEPKFSKRMVKARTPKSEQLASLNLKEGMNSVTFTSTTGMFGMQQVDAKIYFWKWNTRIVISDVDGTITKSDVLGQFMPLVGMDWSQSGVAHLFSAIKENGYQLLFLSARAISQASLTRHFLFNLKQDGKALPDGPVVISPDGLFPSLFREVIRRAPHEFKIACLEDIRALFPPDYNPFYAGFGNRHTDEISYLKVGVPRGKIFTINPRGEIAVNRRIDTRSYTTLHALVHGMFPPTNTSEQEDFNSWNYWKLPPPTIDL